MTFEASVILGCCAWSPGVLAELDGIARPWDGPAVLARVNRSSTVQKDLIHLYDYEARAKQVLSHSYWEHIESWGDGLLTTALTALPSKR